MVEKPLNSAQADVMNIRFATPEDARALARLHVQAWRETYTGVLPEPELAKRNEESRHALWQQILSQPKANVAMCPELGFAQVGRQRDENLLAQGYTQEIYSLYVLKEAHGTGLGRALLDAALGPAPQPFSVFALATSHRACAFYEKSGGTLAFTREDIIGETPVVDHAYIWNTPQIHFGEPRTRKPQT